MRHRYEFKRADGTEVTVRYRYSPGSPDTYSPIYGADGGDAPEVTIDSAETDAGLVELTDAEVEAVEEAIFADPPEYDFDD